MNIFEDLIGELREENLLEDTVIKINPADYKASESQEKNKETIPKRQDVIADEIITNKIITNNDEFKTEPLQSSDSILEKDYSTAHAQVSASNASDKIEFETNQAAPKSETTNEAEFFRQRAVNEVSFLQMVEHVFAGVERDQMKIVPKPYDALTVKKVLHTFLQISKEKITTEHAQAEFQLLQETENWYSTLTHRDKRISVNHLRRYCETARPPLSSPALVSLARFYRNSPYSEQVRGKFDFIVTRLFAKDINNEHREMAFSREELVKHLKELYAEWSSIPLYKNEDDSEILLIALKFEDFITEATVCDSFDELIRNDFFNRLRLFKKETSENFFSPLIVAANVESNIKIGNRYVELLEKEKPNKSIFEDKYGFLHDQSISDATGKTFQLVELLSRKTEKPAFTEPPKVERKKPEIETKSEKRETRHETKVVREIKTDKEKKPVVDKSKPENNVAPRDKPKTGKSYFGVSSWLLTAIIFVVIAAVGTYVWSGGSSSEAKEAVGAKTVNLENSSLKENIRDASIKSEIFTATVLPSWDSLPEQKKQELLKKIISIGADKGFKNVQLLNAAGKIVGSASPEKVEVYNP